MTPYSRTNPSPRFREIAEMYKTLHVAGDARNAIDAARTFDGQSLLDHIGPLIALCRDHGIKTMLDYGAGKGVLHKTAVLTRPDGVQVKGTKAIWGLNKLVLYDPGYAPYSRLPKGRFDAVISTDVLEHIPEEDLPWVLDEIFGHARKLVYLTIALYPARKTLPNGENAHVTLKSPDWWKALLDAACAPYPGVDYHAKLLTAHKGGTATVLSRRPQTREA